MGVDDFVLLKVLGKGNFAKVMQVQKKDTGKIYAMKILNKEQLKMRDQIEHTITERRLLATMEHPFLVRLIYAFQTSDKLYMIMNFVNGGELFFHLKRARKFKEDRARFYAAEICLALQHLHTHEYIYRDLKPENILMTKDGHVCLTDFGLAKELYNGRTHTHTFCGTPEYLAPEIVLNQGHGKPVDWWSFGTLLYEMLVGIPPFYSENVQEMYDMILHSDLYLPDFVSVEAGDLLARLLERDPSKRLGSGPRGVDEIKFHPFFLKAIPDSGLKLNLAPTVSPQKMIRPLPSWVQWWDDVYHKRLDVPFVPKLNGDADTHYFDEEFLRQPAVDSVPEVSKLDESVENAFKGFTFSAEETAIRKNQQFVSTSHDSPASLTDS